MMHLRRVTRMAGAMRTVAAGAVRHRCTTAVRMQHRRVCATGVKSPTTAMMHRTMCTVDGWDSSVDPRTALFRKVSQDLQALAPKVADELRAAQDQIAGENDDGSTMVTTSEELAQYTSLLQLQARALAAVPEFYVVVTREVGSDAGVGGGDGDGDGDGGEGAEEEDGAAQFQRGKVALQLFRSPMGEDDNEDVMLYLFTTQQEADAFWAHVPAQTLRKPVCVPSYAVFAAMEPLHDGSASSESATSFAGIVIDPAEQNATFFPKEKVKDLALLKQALVVDSVLRHVQWDHCNPFPSPMSEDAAKRLPQLLDFPGMLVLANKTQDQVVLAEHVHQDIADDAPVSHKYMCVFTSADRAQDFINASGIGPMCSLVPCDGRVVFGTLRDTEDAEGVLFNPTSTADLEDPSRAPSMGSSSPKTMVNWPPGQFFMGQYGYDEQLPYLCLIQRRHVFGVAGDIGVGPAPTDTAAGGSADAGAGAGADADAGAEAGADAGASESAAKLRRYAA